MSTIFKLFFLIILINSIAHCEGAEILKNSSAQMEKEMKIHNYGEKNVFKKGKSLDFPDFRLTYLGQRRVKSELFLRGFVYYDFRVTSGNISETISWSSGTGDIAPLEFRIENKIYVLELAISDKLGKLKNNELVIWEKNERGYHGN